MTISAQIYTIVRVDVSNLNEHHSPAKTGTDAARAVSFAAKAWLPQLAQPIPLADGLQIDRVTFANEIDWVAIEKKSDANSAVDSFHYDRDGLPMNEFESYRSSHEAHLSRFVESIASKDTAAMTRDETLLYLDEIINGARKIFPYSDQSLHKDTEKQ